MSSRLTSETLRNELIFSYSRSSGPGGQHVNKVNSRVSLRWDVANSGRLTEQQRELLLRKCRHYMNQDGVLLLTAQEERSQLQNKAKVLDKLDNLLSKTFTKARIRKPTRPTKASKAKRLESKKRLSEKKGWRRKL